MPPTAATELHNKRWEPLCVDDKFIVGLVQRAADITARFTTDIRFTGSRALSLSEAGRDRDCNKMSPESNVTLFFTGALNLGTIT